MAITLGLWVWFAGCIVPPSIALIVLEEGGFIMCDQGESKMATRDREPIWAWEFYPIIVPLMEMLLMFCHRRDFRLVKLSR